MSFPSSSPLTGKSLSQRLAVILDALCHTVATRAGRDRAFAPLVLLLWPYLRRLAARFDRLVRPGRRPAPPVAPRSTPRSAPRDRPTPPNRLPRRFAWLVRLAQETAVFGSQLRYLLTEADMAELLATVPQAGRILRPLCRMLAVSPGPDLPPALFPPPRMARAAAQSPPAPSPAAPAPSTPPCTSAEPRPPDPGLPRWPKPWRPQPA